MESSTNPKEIVGLEVTSMQFDQIQRRIQSVKNQLAAYENTLNNVNVHKLTTSATTLSSHVSDSLTQYTSFVQKGAETLVDKTRVTKLLSYIENRNAKGGSLAISVGHELLDYANHAETILANLVNFRASPPKDRSTVNSSELQELIKKVHSLLVTLETKYPGLPVIDRLDKLVETIEPLLGQLPSEIEAELLAHLPVSLDSFNEYLDKVAQSLEAKTKGFTTQSYLREASQIIGYLDKGCSYLQKNWSKKVKLSAILDVGGSIGINAGWGAAVAAKLGDKLGASEALHQEVWAIDVLAPITVTIGTFLKLSQIGLNSAADWIDVEQIA